MLASCSVFVQPSCFEIPSHMIKFRKDKSLHGQGTDPAFNALDAFDIDPPSDSMSQADAFHCVAERSPVLLSQRLTDLTWADSGVQPFRIRWPRFKMSSPARSER